MPSAFIMLILMILDKKPRRSSDCGGRPPALKLSQAELSEVTTCTSVTFVFQLLFLSFFVMTHTEAEKKVRGSTQAMCGGQNITFSSQFFPVVGSGAQHRSWSLLSKSMYILNHLTCF